MADSSSPALCCVSIGLERLKMKVFKDVVGLFSGASSKSNGIGMETGVGNEMKDSFCFEDLSEATKLSN